MMKKYPAGRKPRTGGRYYRMANKKEKEPCSVTETKNDVLQEDVGESDNEPSGENEKEDVFGTIIQVAFSLTLLVVSIIEMSDLLKEAIKNPAQAFWDASFSVTGGLIIGLAVLVIFGFISRFF